MSVPVGIDLGTTNSAVAVLDPAGRPTVVENADGASITPSAVFYEPSNPAKVTVGQAAKDNEHVHPSHVFQAFKRAMDREEPFSQDGQSAAVVATPVELSAFVLKKLAQDAGQRVGEITNAVVTVPANFADEARRATIAAGEAAGLTVDHIVNEPTAALFYYSFEHPVSGTVVVFDFGGGTLDVSVAQVSGRDVEILTSRGDPRLGGVDFDAALTGIIASKYLEATSEELDLLSAHALGKTVEDYKKQLSSRETITVQVTGGAAGRTIFEVTRAEFHEATATLRARAEMLVEGALSDVGLAPGDVGDVFLVGGSTRMPAVSDLLKNIFGRDPVCHVNPDEVVALGAALYAGTQADVADLNAAQTSTVASMQLQDVANHFFGTTYIDVDHSSGPRLRVEVVISKNSPLPVSQTKSFLTVSEGQTAVNCVVTQAATAETDPDFVRRIWEGTLGPLPPNRPANQEIQVTFSYDRNQVMQCSFLDVASGIRQDVSLGAESDTDEDTLDRFEVR